MHHHHMVSHQRFNSAWAKTACIQKAGVRPLYQYTATVTGQNQTYILSRLDILTYIVAVGKC